MYAVSFSNKDISWTHSAWDPTEPIATRPLFTTGSGNRKFFYACDGNKNVSELVHFETRNGIAAHYDYAPFGAVTRAISASAVADNTFTTDNPFSFSSEYHDDTLGLVYYRERERTFHGHYRHYNPLDARWCGRGTLKDVNEIRVYLFIENNPNLIDLLGQRSHSRNLRIGHTLEAIGEIWNMMGTYLFNLNNVLNAARQEC